MMKSRLDWLKPVLPLAGYGNVSGMTIEFVLTRNCRCIVLLCSQHYCMVVSHGHFTKATSRNSTADSFHLRCLRQILHTKWQDKMPNTSVLEKCNITGIEALLVRTQLRWCVHVSRMSDDHIPKRLLYGQLSGAKRRPGGQRKRYKDQLRVNLQACDIDLKRWEALAADRSSWRALIPQCCGQL